MTAEEGSGNALVPGSPLGYRQDAVRHQLQRHHHWSPSLVGTLPGLGHVHRQLVWVGTPGPSTTPDTVASPSGWAAGSWVDSSHACPSPWGPRRVDLDPPLPSSTRSTLTAPARHGHLTAEGAAIAERPLPCLSRVVHPGRRSSEVKRRPCQSSPTAPPSRLGHAWSAAAVGTLPGLGHVHRQLVWVGTPGPSTTPDTVASPSGWAAGSWVDSSHACPSPWGPRRVDLDPPPDTDSYDPLLICAVSRGTKTRSLQSICGF